MRAEVDLHDHAQFGECIEEARMVSSGVELLAGRPRGRAALPPDEWIGAHSRGDRDLRGWQTG